VSRKVYNHIEILNYTNYKIFLATNISFIRKKQKWQLTLG